LADFRSADGKKLAGSNRLYRILISESAYLIWKIRCKRLSNSKPGDPIITETEVRHKWVRAMNLRLELDRTLTKTKYEKKALPRSKVLQTWRRMIKDEKNLPPDWIGSKGVVVGIRLKECQTRGSQVATSGVT
ncbi:hypothetical protein FIBSPDRAFT_742232, partial [Athelia psychrophila]